MSTVKASILTIGSEILYGHILDTNAHFISSSLSEQGIQVKMKLSVADKSDDLITAFTIGFNNSDVVIMTGGLGPTNDDITKKCLSEYFNSPIERNDIAYDDVESYFKKRGLEFTSVNQMQAFLPQVAQPIKNDMGTAPGIWIEKEGKVFIAMPGVPHEMRHMLLDKVLPLLKQKYKTEMVVHKMIMTAGIGESWLSDKIADWEKQLPKNIDLAYLPGYGQVKLKITAKGNDLDRLRDHIQEEVRKLYAIVGKYIYGEDNLKLEEKIGEILRERKLQLAIAESCTGGYISHLVTSIAGSSDYYQGGIVAYANEVKVQELGVQTETIERYGAVSEETVKAMADGVRNTLKTDIGIATSGISGPGGGSEEKPVGLVWIAVSDTSGCVARQYNIPKDRISHIKYASTAALILLWQRLSQNN